jgi:hypothetical protein
LSSSFDRKFVSTSELPDAGNGASPHSDPRQAKAVQQMSEQRFAELYERLTMGKSSQATPERVFLRGYNAGIDFAIKQMKLTCDEVIEPSEAAE